jgi:hypothetical protein
MDFELRTYVNDHCARNWTGGPGGPTMTEPFDARRRARPPVVTDLPVQTRAILKRGESNPAQSTRCEQPTAVRPPGLVMLEDRE